MPRGVQGVNLDSGLNPSTSISVGICLIILATDICFGSGS